MKRPMKNFNNNSDGNRPGKKGVKLDQGFWNSLKKRNLFGYSFLEQLPVYYSADLNEHYIYIPDFHVTDIMLAQEIDNEIKMVEVDHGQHVSDTFDPLEINVLRIENEDLNDLDTLTNKVEIFLTAVMN